MTGAFSYTYAIYRGGSKLGFGTDFCSMFFYVGVFGTINLYALKFSMAIFRFIYLFHGWMIDTAVKEFALLVTLIVGASVYSLVTGTLWSLEDRNRKYFREQFLFLNMIQLGPVTHIYIINI